MVDLGLSVAKIQLLERFILVDDVLEVLPRVTSVVNLGLSVTEIQLFDNLILQAHELSEIHLLGMGEAGRHSQSKSNRLE